MELKLTAPASEMEPAYLDFAAEWEKSGEEITPYSARLLGRSYGQWLADTRRMEKKAPEGFVTGTTRFLTDGSGRILGAVNIRHRLNGPLLASGGHIGYGIRPSERKKGYANRMLPLPSRPRRSWGSRRRFSRATKQTRPPQKPFCTTAECWKTRSRKAAGPPRGTGSKSPEILMSHSHRKCGIVNW